MLLPSLSGELSNLGYIPWPGEGKSIKNEKKKISICNNIHSGKNRLCAKELSFLT